ncbi:MAG: hypothetical protein LUC18_02135 [Porphyromonadaceae bacterium]|nr:hypothetical protein [Porphyromonadaceae bacterium]
MGEKGKITGLVVDGVVYTFNYDMPYRHACTKCDLRELCNYGDVDTSGMIGEVCDRLHDEYDLSQSTILKKADLKTA